MYAIKPTQPNQNQNKFKGGFFSRPSTILKLDKSMFYIRIFIIYAPKNTSANCIDPCFLFFSSSSNHYHLTFLFDYFSFSSVTLTQKKTSLVVTFNVVSFIYQGTDERFISPIFFKNIPFVSFVFTPPYIYIYIYIFRRSAF